MNSYYSDFADEVRIEFECDNFHGLDDNRRYLRLTRAPQKLAAVVIAIGSWLSSWYSFANMRPSIVWRDGQRATINFVCDNKPLLSMVRLGGFAVPEISSVPSQP